MSRTDDVLAARAAADEWAAAHSLPPSGGYSGDWYINGYLDGWWPDGWLYWLADYSTAPELFPARPVHQYTSTPIDMDIMLESEIVNPDFPDVPPNPIPPDSPCDPFKASIERAVNRLQIELDRKTAAGKAATLRRTLIKEIAAELYGALSA